MKYNIEFILLLIISIAFIAIAFVCDGTAGDGDTILHFLYAKYAFQHPENLLNHWAKPLFTLLSAPFAQFGFVGIKLFNALCSWLCIWLTFQVSKRMISKLHWHSIIFYISCPLFIILTFSGLTEPLFALIVALTLYFATVRHQLAWATIFISFLPFVRSEGLILCLTMLVYLSVIKQWKYMPYIAFGHLIYSVIGYFHYRDIFWVFTKIPYTNVGDFYGKGNYLHFFNQMPYIVGIPLFALLLIGFVSYFIPFRASVFNHEKTWLVYGFFVSFFISHTLFWALGLFGSAGLIRVFIGVLPCAVLIMLFGFEFISSIFYKIKIPFLSYFAILYIVLFPFTKNKAGLNFSKSMYKDETQKMMDKVVNKHYKNQYLLSSSPYIFMISKVDLFNKNKSNLLNLENIEKANNKTLIVWDNWFTVVEQKVELKDLVNRDELKLIEVITNEKHDTTIAVFTKNY